MSNLLRFGIATTVALVISLAMSSTVAAQGYPPPPPPGGGPGADPVGPPGPGPGVAPERQGIYGGLGLGIGEMTADCEGCDDALESLSFHFDVGYMINPQLGIFLDGWGLGHPEENPYGTLTLVHAIAVVGVQFWVTPPLWLKAGIGSAQLSFHYEGESAESDTVPGIMLAAGYEVLHSPNFSLDLELRAGSGFFEGGSVHNVALAIAVHWHGVGHRY